MFDELKFHGDINIQPLVGGVDILSDEENEVSGLLEDDIGQQRAAVLLGVGLGREVLYRNIFLRQGEQTAQGNNTLGDEVDAVDESYGRYLLVGEIEAGLELSVEATSHHLRGRSAPVIN